MMCFYEFKKTRPSRLLTPAQSRIHSLKQNLERIKNNCKQNDNDSANSEKLRDYESNETR